MIVGVDTTSVPLMTAAVGMEVLESAAYPARDAVTCTVKVAERSAATGT
jgi:hypothetical protein